MKEEDKLEEKIYVLVNDSNKKRYDFLSLESAIPIAQHMKTWCDGVKVFEAERVITLGKEIEI